MSANVIAGAKSPEALRVTIGPGSSGLDLSTVSSVSLTVEGDGKTREWTTAIESQSASELIVAHTFEKRDVPDPVTLKVRPILTLNDSTERRCARFTLYVNED